MKSRDRYRDMVESRPRGGFGEGFMASICGGEVHQILAEA
jgi:hypothetical protein